MLGQMISLHAHASVWLSMCVKRADSLYRCRRNLRRVVPLVRFFAFPQIVRSRSVDRGHSRPFVVLIETTSYWLSQYSGDVVPSGVVCLVDGHLHSMPCC